MTRVVLGNARLPLICNVDRPGNAERNGEPAARPEQQGSRLFYASLETAAAATAPRMTTIQGGTRQTVSSRKAVAASPKSAADRTPLVQTGE